MKHIQPKSLRLDVIAPLDYNDLTTNADNGIPHLQPAVASRSFLADCIGAISLRWAVAVAVAVGMFLMVWIWATFEFPETMRQVRLVLLLIATGGPND